MLSAPKRRRGRPCKPGRKSDPIHGVRPALDRDTPVHVVLRCTVNKLRTHRVYHQLRSVMAKYFGREDFHITHFSIQTNHLHLIVEADNRERLTRGMQSFAIRAARAIQRAKGISGKVFQFRYHATQISGWLQARRTIAYVLNNWRHHDLDRVGDARSWVLDPYSSGISFTGWNRKFPPPPPDVQVLSVTPPRTRLLRSDWIHVVGKLDPTIRPGFVI